MTNHEVCNAYFEFLLSYILDDEHSKGISYRRLLMHLHDTEFYWSIDMDFNRAQYGIDMRFRFSDDPDVVACLQGPCSVLEMMVALAVQCEEEIMTSPDTDDRTAVWFWDMIDNLGLSDQYDRNYEKAYVDWVLTRFLDRKYEPNGDGGLFYVDHCDKDLTKVEIWKQMLWHLNDFL